MTSTDDQGGATNRRLWLLVGPVVVCAALLLAWSATQIDSDRSTVVHILLAAALLAVAFRSHFTVRVRATQIASSPTSAAVLVCVTFIDPAQVIVATALGITVERFVERQRNPLKFGFNVGKEVVAAAAAAAVASAVGFHPLLDVGGQPLPAVLLALLVAAIAYGVVDEVVSQPVFAMVTGTRVWQQVRRHWDATLLSRAGSVVVAAATVWAYAINPWLVSVVPPLVFVLHLTSADRIRQRQENEAWQRLAQATDELNVVDLDAVLHTAVCRATDLFSADEVEVEVHPPGATPRLVRGDGKQIRFDGRPDDDRSPDGFVIPTALESYQGDADLGELRLRFQGQIKLSERERYTLRTFAAALCTAIRNAATFAETQRLAESHARAAAQDPLTLLANRRRLQEYAAEVLAARPARGVNALLLIDLNHFKEVNDTLGHAAGDQVLIAVAERFAGAVQPEDLVARLGGDEFAVLLVGLSAPAVAMSRAQAVLAALDGPIDLDGMRLSVEASAGVATAPSSGGVGELMRRADVAMYQAKRDGQSVVRYDRALDTADIAALTLGGDLARAITEHQFTVNFQPIVDLGTGEAIAAEALARWHHPDRGDLAPDLFLDAIERSGQLAAFAEAVLDQALAAAHAWADSGFPLAVAVNVSARSLLDPRFPDVVAERLAALDVAAESLIIELTETVTLSQLAVVDDVLGALRQLGVRLALDDFGTGYSSLATLARVPVYELKIDRSFVAAMHDSAPSAVVRSTIDLGRSLGLLVVAEGVESEDQRRQLWELGCPAGQGHLFARPMPAHRLLAALRRGCGGRPGALAPPLHEAGAVIRMPIGRRHRSVG